MTEQENLIKTLQDYLKSCGAFEKMPIGDWTKFSIWIKRTGDETSAYRKPSLEIGY